MKEFIKTRLKSFINSRGFIAVCSDELPPLNVTLIGKPGITGIVNNYAVVCLDPLIVALSCDKMITGKEIIMSRTNQAKICVQVVKKLVNSVNDHISLYEVVSSRSFLRTSMVTKVADDLLLLTKNLFDKNPKNFRMPVSSLNRLFDCYLWPHPVYTLSYRNSMNQEAKIPIDLCLCSSEHFWFSLLKGSRAEKELVPGKTVDISYIRWTGENRLSAELQTYQEGEHLIKGSILADHSLGSHRLFQVGIQGISGNLQDKAFCHTPWFNTNANGRN